MLKKFARKEYNDQIWTKFKQLTNTITMREQSKYKRTTEFKSRETIEYKGLSGGKIHFDEMEEYRDYGNGWEFHKVYWVKTDCREYTNIGRSFFEYKTKEAYMRAKRYAIKQLSK